MSMKKSLIILATIIVAVTVLSVIQSNGSAMLIDMSDTAISFSGIDDFRHEIAYSDIVALTLNDVADWDALGGQRFGDFRVGHLEGRILFATIQSDKLIYAELIDGSYMVFNYNNTNDTEAIYNMLLKNLQ